MPSAPDESTAEALRSSAAASPARRRRYQLKRRNLPLLMLIARETVTSFFRHIFREFGLTEQQWRILRALYEEGELPIGRIAERCFILGPSLTGILQRMVDAGLVVRRLDSEDTRRFYASLTKAGRAKFEAMAPLIEQQYVELERHLGEQRIEALYQIFDDLLERVGDHVPKDARKQE